MAIIGIPRETQEGETRVALVPQLVPMLTRDKHQVLVEKGAGAAAMFADEQYVQSGATLADRAAELYSRADIVLKVHPPREGLREGSTYIGFFAPLAHADVVDFFLRKKITSFSMEYIPRITRAQSMDALSSMATVAGYRAVLLAAGQMGKMFPMLMTAAGTVAPATVLVLGAGVAGLQAIATAKRLGAKVEAFDPRPAVKEQVKSVGATFIDMEITEDVETAGGYAKEQSEAFLRKEREVIGARLPKVHAVITTAQIFGKRAPVLITKEMVELMPQGSVVIDLAAEQGGNCELTRAGATVVHNGVSVVGAVNLPATVPTDASQMYARNVMNLFRHLYPKPDVAPDFSDEIVKGACITRNGELIHDAVRAALQGGSRS